MTVHEYAKYMNVLHDLALIENELRTSAAGCSYAAELLWERF